MCVPVRLCVNMYTWMQVRAETKDIESMEMKSQIVVICLTWVLGTEFESSARGYIGLNIYSGLLAGTSLENYKLYNYTYTCETHFT